MTPTSASVALVPDPTPARACLICCCSTPVPYHGDPVAHGHGLNLVVGDVKVGDPPDSWVSLRSSQSVRPRISAAEPLTASPDRQAVSLGVPLAHGCRLWGEPTSLNQMMGARRACAAGSRSPAAPAAG